MPKCLHLKRSQYRFSIILLILTFGTAMGHPNPVYAKMRLSAYPEKDELVSLPRYCQVRIMIRNRVIMGKADAASDAVMMEGTEWSEKIGARAWNSLHHYCAGLNWINRYDRSSFDQAYPELKLHRHSALNQTMREFAYMRAGVIKNDWILYPELLLKEAYVYTELKNNGQAIKNLREALELRPDYAPLYLQLAEVYRKLGMEAEANAVIKVMAQKTTIRQPKNTPGR